MLAHDGMPHGQGNGGDGDGETVQNVTIKAEKTRWFTCMFSVVKVINAYLEWNSVE